MKLFFIFLLIFIFFLSISSKAQNPELMEKNPKYGCVITKKYSAKQRLQRYPFSKAVKILAISYPFDPRHSDDTSSAYHFDGLGVAIQNGVLDKRGIMEIKELTRSEINYLTAILYNINTKSGKNYSQLGFVCFDDRNALLFYGSDGKIFDYLQVCFECNQIRSQSDRIFFKKGCGNLFEVFKQFFVDVGIEYGTIQR